MQKSCSPIGAAFLFMPIGQKAFLPVDARAANVNFHLILPQTFLYSLEHGLFRVQSVLIVKALPALQLTFS